MKIHNGKNEYSIRFFRVEYPIRKPSYQRPSDLSIEYDPSLWELN